MKRYYASLVLVGLFASAVLAFTYTYDTTTPAGDDSPSVIDNRIREAKAATQERENVDHYWPLTGSEVSDADAGQHRQVTFQAVQAAPADAEMVLHTITDGAASELAYDDPAANNVQITKAGALNLTGEYDQELNLSNTGNTVNTDALACTSAGTFKLPFDTVTAVEGQVKYNDTDDTVMFSNADPAWLTLVSTSTMAVSNTAYGSATTSSSGLSVDVGFAPDIIIAWNDAGTTNGDLWMWSSTHTTANKNICSGIYEGTNLRISVSSNTITFPYSASGNYPNRNTGSNVMHYFAFNFRASVQNPTGP
jgi:hypothetical protein